jgi:hypothetical protein
MLEDLQLTFTYMQAAFMHAPSAVSPFLPPTLPSVTTLALSSHDGGEFSGPVCA